MVARAGAHAALSRRTLLAVPLALFAQRASDNDPPAVERELIAAIDRHGGLLPPLTLGMARVIVRPGASAWAATPSGVRLIAVESGILAVSAGAQAQSRFTSAELAAARSAPEASEELLVPAGTTITFGSRGVASVRNPGGRSTIALDVAIYHEEPRPMPRAFTTDDGVSFQLLASASAAEAPTGRITVTLERRSWNAGCSR
jgi:hypothetical protein